MKFLQILKEDRAERFKEKYSKKFDENTINRIIKLIPPKFLEWVGKIVDYSLIDKGFDQFLMKLVDSIKKFEKISSNLPKSDINQYQSLEELESELTKYENRPRREYKQVEGGNLVYEDDRYYIVNPLTHGSSCYYGRGTKWCTAADSDHHFNQYNVDGKLFYIIDKKLPTNDVNYKIALLYKFDGDKSFWNAKDEKLSVEWYMKHSPIAQKLISEMDDYLQTEFKQQLEIFKDKERARTERERLAKLRQQRIYELQKAEAEERRVNREWDLSNPNIDEEGLEANALLNHLVDDDQYKKFGEEQIERINFLKSEIERLNNEYNESEDTRVDLLDMIEEYEDELETFDEEYIDVYYLIPEGNFFDMTTFKVLGDTEDVRYAVGDEDEMEKSAREYCDGLIDDIGYESFNKSFVEDHVDEELVVDHFRDFYNEDLYSEPENYFEDSQRKLSRSQMSEVEILKNKIEQYKNEIERINEFIDTIENEDEIQEFQEKIEEAESEIEDLNIEIDDITESPEGDFPDDLIEEKLEELLDNVRDSPISYIKDFGMEVTEFINRNDFIEGLINSDGYGIVNSYDGNYDTQEVNGEIFYVMRIE